MRLLRTGKDSLLREKGKAMNQGRTLRFLVVFLSGLLATTTLVYADHFAAAGVKYQLPDDTSDTSVQFSFLRVASPPPQAPLSLHQLFQRSSSVQLYTQTRPRCSGCLRP